MSFIEYLVETLWMMIEAETLRIVDVSYIDNDCSILNGSVVLVSSVEVKTTKNRSKGC